MCPARGSQARAQRPADHLVHRVVPAHVLAQHQQRAVGCEQPGRVQPASAGEHALGLAQPVRQGSQHLRGDPHRVGGDVVAGLDPDRLDALLAADAAGAGGQEVPLRPAGIGGPFDVPWERCGGQRDIGHILVAHPDLPRAGRVNQALAEQEARRQVDVVARGPHGHGQRDPADPDLQRLLHRQQVRPLRGGPGRGGPGPGAADPGTVAVGSEIFSTRRRSVLVATFRC